MGLLRLVLPSVIGNRVPFRLDSLCFDFYYLAVLNGPRLYYPESMLEWLSGGSILPFDIPQLFAVDEASLQCQTREAYFHEHYSCHFLNNAGQNLLVHFILLCVAFSTELIFKFNWFKSQLNGKRRFMFRAVRETFGFGLVVKMICSYQLVTFGYIVVGLTLRRGVEFTLSSIIPAVGYLSAAAWFYLNFYRIARKSLTLSAISYSGTKINWLIPFVNIRTCRLTHPVLEGIKAFVSQTLAWILAPFGTIQVVVLLAVETGYSLILGMSYPYLKRSHTFYECLLYVLYSLFIGLKLSTSVISMQEETRQETIGGIMAIILIAIIFVTSAAFAIDITVVIVHSIANRKSSIMSPSKQKSHAKVADTQIKRQNRSLAVKNNSSLSDILSKFSEKGKLNSNKGLKLNLGSGNLNKVESVSLSSPTRSQPRKIQKGIYPKNNNTLISSPNPSSSRRHFELSKITLTSSNLQ